MKDEISNGRINIYLPKLLGNLSPVVGGVRENVEIDFPDCILVSLSLGIVIGDYVLE
jgi:hypothetical protein